MKKCEMPITGIDGEVLGYWSTNSGRFKAVLQKDKEGSFHAFFYKDGVLMASGVYIDRDEAINKTVSKINDAYFVDGWIYKTRAGNIKLKWERPAAAKNAPCLF
jgi:hypothetical protein